MGYSRNVAPATPPDRDALTAAMAGIGMAFAVEPDLSANIEDTLLFASMEAMEHDDLRVLAVLVSWFDVYSSWINADRLTLLIRTHESRRVRALWAALAKWKKRDRRFARLSRMHRGPRIRVPAHGNDFHLRRHGEDPRFRGTALLVPANLLRQRPSDILTPAQLARVHRAFRLRVMIGPTYRADLWAALEQEPDLSAADLARRAYSSFASAWQVKHDAALLCEERPPEPGAKRRPPRLRIAN